MTRGKETLVDADFNLTKTQGKMSQKDNSPASKQSLRRNPSGKTAQSYQSGQESSNQTLVDFNLTKTQKSAIPSGKNTMRKTDVNQLANQMQQKDVNDIFGALA